VRGRELRTQTEIKAEKHQGPGVQNKNKKSGTQGLSSNYQDQKGGGRNFSQRCVKAKDKKTQGHKKSNRMGEKKKNRHAGN